MPQSSSKAQSSLEYLMTYGWALILIATVIAVLVYIVGSPSSDITFSSSDPAKILIKAGAVSGSSAEIKLQNITGGGIEITGILNEGYSGCTVNGSLAPLTVAAGGQMTLECTAPANNQGIVTLQYTDFASLQRSVVISSNGAISLCGNDNIEIWEACDGTLGVPPMPDFSCKSDCSAIQVDELAGCFNIISPGRYELSGDITRSGPANDCIVFMPGSDNSTLDCASHTIDELGPGTANSGIYLDNVSDITLQNCNVRHFEYGIRADGGSRNVITGNDVSQAYDVGILIINSPNSQANSNNASGNDFTGIEFISSNNFEASSNTANNNGASGILIRWSNMGIIGSNTANGNGPAGGVLLEDSTDLTVNNNTMCSNTGDDADCTAPTTILSSGGNTADNYSSCAITVSSACS